PPHRHRPRLSPGHRPALGPRAGPSGRVRLPHLVRVRSVRRRRLRRTPGAPATHRGMVLRRARGRNPAGPLTTGEDGRFSRAYTRFRTTLRLVSWLLAGPGGRLDLVHGTGLGKGCPGLFRLVDDLV